MIKKPRARKISEKELYTLNYFEDIFLNHIDFLKFMFDDKPRQRLKDIQEYVERRSWIEERMKELEAKCDGYIDMLNDDDAMEYFALWTFNKQGDDIVIPNQYTELLPKEQLSRSLVNTWEISASLAVGYRSDNLCGVPEYVFEIFRRYATWFALRTNQMALLEV